MGAEVGCLDISRRSALSFAAERGHFAMATWRRLDLWLWVKKKDPNGDHRCNGFVFLLPTVVFLGTFV